MRNCRTRRNAYIITTRSSLICVRERAEKVCILRRAKLKTRPGCRWLWLQNWHLIANCRGLKTLTGESLCQITWWLFCAEWRLWVWSDWGYDRVCSLVARLLGHKDWWILYSGLSTIFHVHDILDTDRFWNEQLLSANKHVLFGCYLYGMEGWYAASDVKGRFGSSQLGSFNRSCLLFL